jgi:hypothetical protein
MKTHKPLLLLTLLFWSAFAHSAFNYSCVDKDKPTSPSPRTYTDSDGNTHETDAYKAWKNSYPELNADWGCCDKLVQNASTKVCEDPSLADSSLQECSAHTQCSDGKGCYTRTEDDLFDTESVPEDQEAAMAEKEKKYEEQQNGLGEGGDKGAGEACYTNKECESYVCKKFKCEASPKICRIAIAGDYAPGAVKCEEPLTKDPATSICGGEPSYYSGLLGDIIVGQKPGGTRCEFQLYPTGTDSAGTPLGNEHLQGAVNLAIKTSRSMEWLYSTVSNARHTDCLYTRNYMQDKMVDLIARRRDILKAYNEDMLFVEDNFKLINAAALENKSPISTLCAVPGGGSYELTTQHDVASRKATGLDFLCYMKERNLLYQEYENLMNVWHADLQKVLTAYRDTASGWGEKDKSWNLAGTNHEAKDRGCRDWTDWHKKIKRRWSERYKVKGKHGENYNTVEKEGVKEYLSFLSDSNAHKSFQTGKYFLLDPLMPGGYQQGMNFRSFGDSRNLNGDEDRKLHGNDGLADIYDKFEARMLAYVKTLRKDLPPENFIHEPEIRGSYEMRGCVDNLNDPKCAKFREYLADIKDFAFAQFLAYSRHYKKKYKDYFKNGDSWRWKLFNRYDVDLVNLQKYYTALSGANGLRTMQNKCLDDLINGINKDFTDTDPSGVNTGESNYYNTNTNYQGTGGGRENYNKPKIKQNYGTPRSFKLSGFNNSMKDNGAMKDGMTGKNGAGSGSVGNANIGSGALASRVKAMEDANAKALARGVDLKAKAEELQSNMAKAGLMSGGGGAMAARGGSGAAGGAGSGGSGHTATLDSEKEMDASKNAQGANVGKGAAAGAGGGDAGALMGVVAGSGAGYDAGAAAGAGAGAVGDASGMSDEEKDRMSANYDRTKSEYKTKDDDTLFQVLSKTYVRNLDKLLTRKKKLEEDAASAPSEPSRP